MLRRVCKILLMGLFTAHRGAWLLKARTFGARPLRPGQIERGHPKRTGDGTHETHAIARKPGQPARIERLLRARLEEAGANKINPA
ncbi:MAG: hypothetical protein ACRECP_07565 [Methylocella sp.]